MYVYALRNKINNKIISRKAKGGAYYKREGDARNKIGNDKSVEVVRFELVEIQNGFETKGRKYLYQYSSKLLSRKQKYWNLNDYKTYELVETF